MPLQAGQRSSITFDFIRFIVVATPGTTTKAINYILTKLRNQLCAVTLSD